MTMIVQTTPHHGFLKPKPPTPDNDHLRRRRESRNIDTSHVNNELRSNLDHIQKATRERAMVTFDLNLPFSPRNNEFPDMENHVYDRLNFQREFLSFDTEYFDDSGGDETTAPQTIPASKSIYADQRKLTRPTSLKPESERHESFVSWGQYQRRQHRKFGGKSLTENFFFCGQMSLDHENEHTDEEEPERSADETMMFDMEM